MIVRVAEITRSPALSLYVTRVTPLDCPVAGLAAAGLVTERWVRRHDASAEIRSERTWTGKHSPGRAYVLTRVLTQDVVDWAPLARQALPASVAAPDAVLSSHHCPALRLCARGRGPAL